MFSRRDRIDWRRCLWSGNERYIIHAPYRLVNYRVCRRVICVSRRYGSGCCLLGFWDTATGKVSLCLSWPPLSVAVLIMYFEEIIFGKSLWLLSFPVRCVLIDWRCVVLKNTVLVGGVPLQVCMSRFVLDSKQSDECFDSTIMCVHQGLKPVTVFTENRWFPGTLGNL